jgi:DNA-binding SARP family transcriptional activator
VRLVGANQTVRRFRAQNVAALLAYLALPLDRANPRDALIDLIWPDTDRDAGRADLRTALSSLRRQLEPPASSRAR